MENKHVPESSHKVFVDSSQSLLASVKVYASTKPCVFAKDMPLRYLLLLKSIVKNVHPMVSHAPHAPM